MTEATRAAIELALGHSFANQGLLELALRHASGSPSREDSNERLEFLGDAILGMCICEYLFRMFPSSLEGDMTKLKSLIVSRKMCATIATERGYAKFLSVGKGMSKPAELPASVAAAVVEALIGAVYLDGGIEPARALVIRDFGPSVAQFSTLGHHENFKSVLQQMAVAMGMGTPEYRVLDEKGPDHARCFEVCAEIGARRFAPCWGMSKKVAEQGAARSALIELGTIVTGEDGVDRVDYAWGRIPKEPSIASKAPVAPAASRRVTSRRKSARRK